jgi:hypothetical protein
VLINIMKGSLKKQGNSEQRFEMKQFVWQKSCRTIKRPVRLQRLNFQMSHCPDMSPSGQF